MKQSICISRKYNNSISPKNLYSFRTLPKSHLPNLQKPTKIQCAQNDQSDQNSAQEVEERENVFDGPGFNFWIPAAYLFFVTGSIDAGYSGDWSRIGAISKDTEEVMKIVSIGFGFLHLASVGMVFALGKQREKINTVSNIFKGLLLGPLYVIEAFLAP